MIQRDKILADPDQREKLLVGLPTLVGNGIEPATGEERQIDGAKFWRSGSVASQSPRAAPVPPSGRNDPRPRADAPGRATARSPRPGCGSRSPRRGPRPAPTSVPVRPAPAATRHGKHGSGPAAPAGPPRSARRSSPAHRGSRVQETGRSSGADGPIVTGTPRPPRFFSGRARARLRRAPCAAWSRQGWPRRWRPADLRPRMRPLRPRLPP